MRGYLEKGGIGGDRELFIGEICEGKFSDQKYNGERFVGLNNLSP